MILKKWYLVFLVGCLTFNCQADEAISTTELTTLPDDPAAAMVAGIDRFLLNRIAIANDARPSYWGHPDSLAKNLTYLKQQLGLEPNRMLAAPEVQWPPVRRANSFDLHAVSWPVLSHPSSPTQASLSGEGALWLPHQPIGSIAIFISHSGQVSSVDPAGENRKRSCELLAANGFSVLEIASVGHDQIAHRNAKLSRREFLHRPAFELGRTVVGYEIQMIQSAIDWLSPLATTVNGERETTVLSALPKVILAGWGEGGRTALLAAVVEPRIELTVAVGYFGPRDNVWQEPIDRALFGVFNRYVDAEFVAAIAPRQVLIQTHPMFKVDQSGDGGGAPAQWQSPNIEAVRQEFARLEKLDGAKHTRLIEHDVSDVIKDWIGVESATSEPANPVVYLDTSPTDGNLPPVVLSDHLDRQLAMIDLHTQSLLQESEYARAMFMNLGHSGDDADLPNCRLDTSSPAAYTQSIERFRQTFRDQVIGWYDDPLLAPAAKSKPSYKGNLWTGHDVVLDVFPNVFAYGVLLVPNDISPNEKRPVVVCQHGLEGRPQDTIQGDHYAYHDFAAKLAELGYIVFAPQNPYTGRDTFRTLQRKSYPLGKTLFSVIGAQHLQILHWLKSIPMVDPERIAFYGLSYGGKSAMRLPALLPDYCMSICSADFNDWVWKNASTRSKYSYVGTGEYEIFEFGLGKTFNYAEMAALIAPRPFMVERGHYDGVGPDDRVAKEFAKVRFLYAARLKLADRCRIEWFDGPHTINGQGTFEFLKKYLKE